MEIDRLAIDDTISVARGLGGEGEIAAQTTVNYFVFCSTSVEAE